VSDQIGAPTPSRLVADCIAHAIHCAMRERTLGHFRSATLHVTSSGSTSWHGFASAIISAAHNDSRLATLVTQRVLPISTSEYPLPAPRPKNSRLDCSGFEQRFDLSLPDWRIGLMLTMAELR
jgi:dTDP-4-dehydrorhamnose reductase